MSGRVDVIKTWKLFINGAFPRSESGRSIAVHDSRGLVIGHVAHASRKDLRDAVEAARAAQPKWAAMTAYNRGQVLYRMAEMMEGKRAEFAEALRAGAGKPGKAALEREVQVSIDRLVCFAGWADKVSQVLGSQNPVAGPYYNFTAVEPCGVVAAVCPDEPALLGLISLMAPALCAGNAVVALASDAKPLPGALMGEVCATSDVPAGVVNILTGRRAELVEHIAGHREINAVVTAIDKKNAKPQAAMGAALRAGAAENLKRVKVFERDSADWFDSSICENPAVIEPFVEFKTVWHPSGA